MDSITYNSLTDKLKNAPQNVLERVSGYVDALLDSDVQDYVLSEDQKRILDSQENLALNQFTDAHEIYDQLKSKNGL
ncbi:hypothetical protein A5893_16550 [Pedobacter psychrophilus]|uniref:Uncharacterized protein n=1 Tax=Pedobacter psychrophilus TaxID=1826909 RepID=A0A179DAB5_9SPHI|nr:hypothetical protein [Pedobacter psychrophilus]OAQ37977.1 hypothetical protein A5893_16550 [Pedobacter psychrophilus]